MDHSRLLHSPPRELALYLRDEAGSTSTEAVTKDILARVEDGSLPASVFSIWCTASGDPQVIKHGFDQDFSRLAQRSAVKRFGKLMQTSQPNIAWDAVGGLSGILDFLSHASVSHVRLFCDELARYGAKTIGSEQRQALADQLVQSLHRQPQSGTRHSTDRRPLQSYYRALLPACSPQVRKTIRAEDNILDLPMSVQRDRLLRTIRSERAIPGALSNLKTLMNDNGSIQNPQQSQRISSNMLFGLELMQALAHAEGPILNMSTKALCEDVIHPLFRRMERKKTCPALVTEAVRCFTKYCQKNEREIQQVLNMSSGGIIWCVARRWMRHSDQLNGPLRSLVALLRHSDGGLDYADDIVNLVRAAPPDQRLPMLHLLLRHIKNYSADIDSDEELAKLRFRWPPELFLLLPGNSGIHLAERVIASKPTNYWKHWTSHAQLRKQHRGDPTCLLLMLSKQQPNSLTKARNAVEDRKHYAVKARPQQERAFWAQCALDCSVASGSLDLCRDSMLWVTRFRKDPLTVKDIYSHLPLDTEEGVQLLRGFPTRYEVGFPSADVIRQQVQTANHICLELLQEACEALKEPSFHISTWRSSLTLFRRVVASRILDAPLLQSRLKLTTEELYKSVFEDTLDIALKLEDVQLQDAHSQLCQGPSGALPWTTNKAALKFADELARRRDGIWETWRWRDHAATLDLNNAYPRGLPLQYLCFNEVESKIPDCKELSYMQARAAKIVFVEPILALEPIPEEQELLDAVGFCVDDWNWALRAHVSFSTKPDESALSAWKHAIGPLSETRMSSFEAFSFWSTKFQKALRGLDVYGPWDEALLSKIPSPRVPSVEDGSMAEWYPDSDARPYTLKPRKLRPTNLDAMAQVQFRVGDARNPWFEVSAPLIGTVPQNLWERFQGHCKVEPSTREALVCSALLYLTEEMAAASEVFSKPFPSPNGETGRARYPALYIDGEFLQQHRGQSHVALCTLKQFCRYVPASLLQQLLTSIFLNSTPGADVEIPRTAFELLKLLAEGDRPQLALDLLQHLVLDRPSDSSWQRKLFSKGTLKSLPADTTRIFVGNLSTSIRKRLAETQATRSPHEKSDKKPSVKVTTVKMLAQLLAGAEVIDEKMTLDVLTDLFAIATHHDIRVSVVDAMLQIMVRTDDENIQQAVIESLEQHAITIVSNVNERQPVSEELWAECEITPELLPEASIDASILPPMLSTILTIANTTSVDEGLREKLFIRILLPTLQKSIEEHARWMKHFFRHMDIPAVALPRSPVHPLLLSELLRSPEFLPANVLDLWLDMFTAREMPTHDLDAVHEKVRDDKETKHAAARNYWNSFWAAAEISQHRNRPGLILKQDIRISKVFNGIDHAKLQDAWLRQADIVLWKPKHKLDESNTILKDVVPALRGCVLPKPPELSRWMKYTRPLAQSLIDKVGAIRTPAWQRDPERVPNILPDISVLRVWLLLLPEGNHNPSVEHTFSIIIPLLNELASSTRLYADRLERMMDQVLRVHRDTSEVIKLALKLGTIPIEETDNSSEEVTELPGTVYLRIAFAGHLLECAGVPSPKEKSQIINLYTSWMKCSDEDIRMTGMECAKKATPSRGQGYTIFEDDEWDF